MNRQKFKSILQSKEVKFIFFLIIIGFFIGFFLALDMSEKINDIKLLPQYLEDGHVSFASSHLIFMLFIYLVLFTKVSIILLSLYLVWESICISSSIILFLNAFGFKGLLIGLFYNVILKLVLLSGIAFMLYLSRKIKKDDKIDFNMKKIRLKFISAMVIIFIYDIFLYFFGNNILLKLF